MTDRMKNSKVITGIADISTQMYDVVKVPNEVYGDIYFQPDTFTVYKETGGYPLGTVKDRYFPIQPSVLLDAAVDCMSEARVSYDKLEFHQYKNSSKISFRFPLGTISFKNIRGKEDETELYVNIFNGYNGATKVRMFISTYRLICSNGMKAWRSETVGGFVNAESNQYNAEKFIKNLYKVIDKTETMKEHYEIMNRREINAEETKEFVLKALNLPDIEYADLSTRAKNNFKDAMDSVELEFERTGTTAYGLLNGITHFTNHKKRRVNIDEYLMLDSGLLINDRAQRQALQLVGMK